MGFIEPITIMEAVESVNKREFLLPAIQREFVWRPEQIERLFDSLMRSYPIGSFLFWQVEEDNIINYQFYEFVRNFHERDNRHNPKANLSGGSKITAILDGQQRLTALYLGLKGTYAYKLPRKRWDNDLAFPVRKLCLNLLSPSEDSDFNYDFRFLTQEEREQFDENNMWFEVGGILNLKEEVDVNDYLTENDILKFGKEKFKFANRTLFNLHAVIHRRKVINFFLEKDGSLDKVLNIFIRVNSGGTQLSYSDLLLSIATAQWENKDAREEITSFVDEINSIGDGFNISKDFVLKSCLVLGGFKDIAFKVDNFNQENMLKIENQWDEITKAIRGAFILVSSLGYNRDKLTANYALIPITNYLFKIKSPANFSEASYYKEERQKIFKWLIAVLLKRTFSAHPDNVLRQMREVISKAEKGFPFDEIFQKLKGTAKSIAFDADEICNLLFCRYGQAYTFSVLAFLYPSLDFRNKFHQDHIFPKRLFTKKKLEKRGISEQNIDFFIDKANQIGNLQLLEGVPNQEKSGKEFREWLMEKYPDSSDRKDYMRKHYIPDVDLGLEHFREFIEEREKLIFHAFSQLIA